MLSKVFRNEWFSYLCFSKPCANDEFQYSQHYVLKSLWGLKQEPILNDYELSDPYSIINETA
jgi:hypothetical protein